jgi:hypothetical protein
MAVDDFLEPEVAAAAAVTAVIASPKVRQVLRRGAVLGLAGILAVGDAVTTLVKGVGHGAQQASKDIGTLGQPVAAAHETGGNVANAHKAGGKHTAHHKQQAPVAEQSGTPLDEPQGGTAE